MENNELITRIKQRTEVLENARIKLKEKFIGIDIAIDQIIDNISLWYVTPEFQFRPTIVNLWGITGVGKTDLVRTLVSLLNFNDYFIEIQMDIKVPYKKNIEDYIDGSGITPNDSVIVLLDEIQRFRTIDENGKMIQNNEYYNDIWQLLSDGKFQNKSQIRHELMEMLMEELYYRDMNDNSENDIPSNSSKKEANFSDDDTVEKKKKQRKYNTSAWSANRLKKKLKLNIGLEEIMSLNFEEKIRLIDDTIKSGNANESQAYEKMLIFISGNLDEAYFMSDDVENAESDADIFHELSKRITIIDIKAALTTKFKPEQIARLGNNHVIYPCLNREAYSKIIEINCDKILNKISTEHGIRINLSKNVYDIIYRNGVFPTQGVRPVITTIFNLLGNNVPFFIYHAKINNVNDIFVDVKDSMLFTKFGDEVINKKIILDIDNIKKNKHIDEISMVVVHEIGHALLYALSFGIAPPQINLNSTNSSTGFVIRHPVLENKSLIKKSLSISLAGQVAEELVFGDDYKSSGSASDIKSATLLASNYVRSFGMDGNVSKIYNPHININELYNYDIDKTNQTIENLLVEAKINARDLINANLNAFKDLIAHGKSFGNMRTDDFITICNKHGLNIREIKTGDVITTPYSDMLNKFLSV